MRILALDVGLALVKAAVLEVATASPVGSIASVPYEPDCPTPDASEVPAARLWDAVAAAARAAMRHAGVAGVPGKDVEGVGLSCLTPALVLLDKADKPLGPLRSPLDRRARPAARQVWAVVGEEFLASVGNRPVPGGISALCYRQQLNDDPYLAHRVRSYLHLNGWLGQRMTGERAFDPANASCTGLYGTLTDHNWSQRWCEYFEVETSWLPPVIEGNRTLGTLRAEAAAELGVTAGLPVKLGTADTSSAILGANLGPGDLLHDVGTIQTLAVLTDAQCPDPRRLTRQLGVGNLFVYITYNPVGAVALDWLLSLCFREQGPEEFFERTVPAALARRTRITLDPPFLAGDPLEIEACRASFRDLELTTDRLDLLAAMLEALVRRHREALTALGVGDQRNRVFLTGPGADVVKHMLPDYQNSTVTLPEEASLRGVACLFQNEK
jgi:sugar (pentulose or hexulose) kinase